MARLPQVAISRRVVLGCIVSACVGACEASQPTDTPDGTVREFVARIRGFRGADSDAQALFELLSERARTNLEGRAARYSAASGKKIAPWSMLVPSRMRPKFQPQTYTAQIVGQYAMVDIVGAGPNEVAQVPCVLEDEHWRVDLVLPALPAARVRPGLND